MNKWLIGARVKTLPAAISPVLVGSCLAEKINLYNASLALVVSLSLQIAVNFANDFSDGIRGTDSSRVGPTRLVASKLASADSVRNASFIAFFVASVAGTILAVNTSLWLILIGVISILAAWSYTGGRKPYGYLGFGELSVFLFFGVVATVGSYYAQTEQITLNALLLSVPIGSLSCAILVINNLRDLSQDKVVSKRTMAVKLGDAKTRLLYTILVILAQLSALLAASFSTYALLTLIWIPFSYNVVRQVLAGASGEKLIVILGKTSRLQLLIAITLAFSLLI